MGDAKIAETLGGKIVGDSIIIPFYGVDYRVTISQVTDMRARPANAAVTAVLSEYYRHCPESPPEDGPWITCREFSGAGPLMGYFTTNTNKLIETAFADNAASLDHACLHLGGKPTGDPGYDVSVIFSAFPRVPILFRFNGRDATLPAQCSLLFRKSAENYLDMKSMGVCGTWLAGNLISHQ